ncbi:LOW QUALITY PROTEIN: uncharacterized protein LOC115755387 [Rhodamnia argentea]|uniref:LOW QUALITY PROTEIN: uncharacterized protein LOC115755387 n=1 Tax=Rhodamnia argentea TaxID=178133 RepID=A0ABM3HW56_9MYRT|nr:LOW QUALITY PROTEIN: uncharacterized protein LOC115755387 [Rhodamnia argentea]
MPQELPGFYFDAEKNRYFPIKGPIPGSKSKPSSSGASSISSSTPTQCRPVLSRTSVLLETRELNGNPLWLKHAKCKFQDEFLKIHASRPQVWAFHKTDKMADGALEQMRLRITTPEGQTAMVGLLAGGRNGSLSFCEVGKVGQHFDYGVKCMPEHVWPLKREHEECKVPVHLWRSPTVQFSSDVSCIKMPGKRSITVDGDPIQHALYPLLVWMCCILWSQLHDISPLAHLKLYNHYILFSLLHFHSGVWHLSRMITTLGSERSGGSVHTLNLAEPFDFPLRTSIIRQRLHDVASLHCTIWTADCSFNGSQAIVGTNLGAALVNLENGVVSWVCRGKSDVLALQFDQSGNLALCGFRNGAIVTVDVRENQGVSSSRLISHQIPSSPSERLRGHSQKQWFKLSGKIYPTDTTYMPKSICSLVSLRLYDQYFLASSMDGSINLYDHRQIKKGPVQSYEGHVNSHTRTQLGTDPSEKFLLSGGEDCYMRLWKIKSGKLLFEDKFSTSVPLVTCCQSTERYPIEVDGRQNYMGYSHGQHESWGSWLGSRDGLYYAQWY